MSLLKKQNKFEESIKAKLSELETKPSDSLWAKMEKELDTDSFEPTMRSKFEDFSLPVSEKTWNNIEAQLPQEKNKKRILAFWFSGIFLSALSIGFLISRIYFPAIPSENKIALNTESNIQSKNSILQTQPSSEVNSTTHDETSIQHDRNTSSAQIEEATASDNPNVISNSVQNKEASSALVVVENENALSPVGSQKTKNRLFTAKSNQTKTTKNKTVVNNQTNSESGNPTIQATNPPIITKQTQSQNSEAGSENPDLNNVPKSEVRQLAEVDPKIKLEDVQIKFDRDSVARGHEANTENYATDEDKPGKFSISAMVGVYRTEMILSKPSLSVYNLDKAFELRTKLEKASIDWSGGFLLNYHVNKNWMLSSGIQISNFKQDLHYDLADPISDTFGQIQSQNLYLHPSDSIIEGHVKTAVNKYSFTEIPIWITYSILTDKKVGFDFMLGYSLALLTSVNAYMPDPACIGLLNVNDKASFPTIKGTSFLNFAPAVNYRINNTVQVGLMSQFKLGLSSVIDNKNWIQEKPMAVGFSFYLRKRF